jgi:hypothetical protein
MSEEAIWRCLLIVIAAITEQKGLHEKISYDGTMVSPFLWY